MFWKRRTYLDYAAGVSGNPSSPHEEGRRSRDQLEGARREIANLTEVQSDDVIFTSGATESNALAILGHVRALRLRAGKDTPGRNNMHVMYLPSAHASVVGNMKLIAEEGVEVEELPIRDVRVDIGQLATMLRKETVLVSMDAVCGETGVVWNTREVAHMLKTFAGTAKKSSAQAARPIQHDFSAAPAPVLHVDASQAPFTEKISRAHFGADMLTFDASKVGAIRGIGALIAHRTIPIIPIYAGGGQERGLRSGSQMPELAKEFAAALRAAAFSREAFRASSEQIRAGLIKAIISTIPNAYINEGHSQAPNILNLSFIGRDTDYLVALLDEAGFAVSTRSACETDSDDGSRAVFYLTGDKGRARATLRISWGQMTRSRELVHFAQALARAVVFIDSSNRG